MCKLSLLLSRVPHISRQYTEIFLFGMWRWGFGGYLSIFFLCSARPWLHRSWAGRWAQWWHDNSHWSSFWHVLLCPAVLWDADKEKAADHQERNSVLQVQGCILSQGKTHWSSIPLSRYVFLSDRATERNARIYSFAGLDHPFDCATSLCSINTQYYGIGHDGNSVFLTCHTEYQLWHCRGIVAGQMTPAFDCICSWSSMFVVCFLHVFFCLSRAFFCL